MALLAWVFLGYLIGSLFIVGGLLIIERLTREKDLVYTVRKINEK